MTWALTAWMCAWLVADARADDLGGAPGGGRAPSIYGRGMRVARWGAIGAGAGMGLSAVSCSIAWYDLSYRGGFRDGPLYLCAAGLYGAEIGVPMLWLGSLRAANVMYRAGDPVSRAWGFASLGLWIGHLAVGFSYESIAVPQEVSLPIFWALLPASYGAGLAQLYANGGSLRYAERGPAVRWALTPAEGGARFSLYGAF